MKLTKLNIDVVRLIAAFMIIAIHIYPLSVFSNSLDYIFTRIIFRIAVPVFLMITGYFILPKSLENVKILKEYTFKILKIYGISMLIYLPINIYNGYFSKINIITIIKDILINGTIYHLWYFPALILGIWITYFMLKKIKNNLIKILIFFLFLIGLFGDNYYGLVSDINVINSFYKWIFYVFDYTRNGFFFVPIFLYIGYQFREKENKLNIKQNLFLLITFLILMIFEGIILKYFNFPRHTSMYLFLIPLSYYLFNLLIYHIQKSNKKIRNMATWIYILHPLFIVIVRLISKLLNLEIIVQNSLINYFLVLFFTTFFVFLGIKMKESKS